MNKLNKFIIFTISALVAFSTSLLADKPRDWQLGFQEPASQSMGEIVWFHNYMLGANNYCDKRFCFILAFVHHR